MYCCLLSKHRCKVCKQEIPPVLPTTSKAHGHARVLQHLSQTACMAPTSFESEDNQGGSSVQKTTKRNTMRC